jgi:hypothetical protein
MVSRPQKAGSDAVSAATRAPNPRARVIARVERHRPVLLAYAKAVPGLTARSGAARAARGGNARSRPTSG